MTRRRQRPDGGRQATAARRTVRSSPSSSRLDPGKPQRGIAMVGAVAIVRRSSGDKPTSAVAIPGRDTEDETKPQKTLS